MKLISTAAIVLASVLPSWAALQEAYMILPDETYSTVYLESADENKVAYRETRQAGEDLYSWACP